MPTATRRAASTPARDAGALAGVLGEQATRSRILQGAAKVFARTGVGDATVQDILCASGVSRKTFYRFFGSKDDALLALFEITTETLIANVRAARTSDDPLVRLTQSLDAYLELWASGGTLSFVLQTEAMRAGSPLAPLRERTLDTLTTLAAGSFRKRSQRDIDPLVFRSFFLALDGLLARAHRSGEANSTELARVRRVIASLMVGALSADDLPSPEPNRD